MAASFYVYEDIENYNLLYPVNQTVENEIPITSWHIFPKKGVWVVVDLQQGKVASNSVLSSLNIILTGKRGLDRIRTPDLIDIDISNIKFFYKDNQITFHSDEAVYEYRVDRYVGEPISRGKLKDYLNPQKDIGKFAFYDAGRNRINLILKTPDETLTVSNPSPVSSS